MFQASVYKKTPMIFCGADPEKFRSGYNLSRRKTAMLFTMNPDGQTNLYKAFLACHATAEDDAAASIRAAAAEFVEAFKGWWAKNAVREAEGDILNFATSVYEETPMLTIGEDVKERMSCLNLSQRKVGLALAHLTDVFAEVINNAEEPDQDGIAVTASNFCKEFGDWHEERFGADGLPDPEAVKEEASPVQRLRAQLLQMQQQLAQAEAEEKAEAAREKARKEAEAKQARYETITEGLSAWMERAKETEDLDTILEDDDVITEMVAIRAQRVGAEDLLTRLMRGYTLTEDGAVVKERLGKLAAGGR